MTAIPQSTSARLLSGRLIDPLQRVAQRHWYVLAAVGVLKTLVVSLLALLAAAMLLGYFDHLWMPLRVVLAAAAWVTVLWSAVRFLRPALRRWSLSRAAQHVEAQSPALQERLSSAVELSAERDPAFRGSDALLAHLVSQAETDAGAVRPEQVVRSDQVFRWSLLLIPVLLAWLVLVSLPGTTKTAMGGLYRVLMPWKATLPTLLTQVIVQPGDVTLVQGDPIDITAHVSFETNRNAPGHAVLVRQFENGQKLSDDMDSAGAGDYRIHFDDLQQGFKYKVITDQGDSPMYSATIHPRPQIESIDVRCDYPAYTGLSATLVSGRDGNVEAVVGTRVTLTVHTALPVVTDKSQIVIDEGTPDQLILPLKQVAEGKPDYQAQLIVNHSGEYKINLINEFDLTNKDEQPRSIVAQPDEVPTIVIRSPELQISVRPDDTIPVKYEATDDFGVAKIEAVLQADHHPAQTVPIPFKTDDKRSVNGPDFQLSVADALKAAGLTESDRVDHITYQLKVTDNRDPDPQFSFSSKQTLKINRQEYLSYQEKNEKKIADDLRRAIEKAIDQLNREQNEVQPVKDIDARQHLEPWHQKQLHQATQDLPHTSRDLQKAADEARATVFQDVAREVQKIATHPIRGAAEDATQADLNQDNGQDRKDAATKAVAEITDARTQLQKILEKQEIQKDERAAAAARELAEAARKQQEAAAMMKPRDQANQPQDQQQRQQQRQQQEMAMRKQGEANQKLHQALDNSEALRDPKAAETAQKLEDLIRKVEETQKQQDQAAEQTEKQQAATDIQQKANELAQKQEALNNDIAHTAEQHKDALQKASANPPNKDQQNNIVKALNKNELQQAHDQMKQAANQLHQEAQQLHNQAHSKDLHPDQKQQEAMNRDQQAQQKAQDQKNQEEQAANALKQAAQQSAAPKPDDSAVKNAEEAAKEIEKQAADLHADNADAKHEAEAAQQDAQAAEKAADQAAHAANPQEAQQDLNKAAKDLNKAGQELADAAKKNADADKAEMVKAQQQEAQAAAQQADSQAQQQDALAKAIEGEQNDLAKVKQNQQSPDQNAQQQNQIADKADAEQQAAEQLQHQAKDANNDNVSHRAEQAKADLAQAHQHAAEAAKAQQQAAQHQQEAANAHDAGQAKNAEQNADRALEQAAQQQQQAQDALAKAENELRDLPAEMAQADANPEHNGGEHPDAQNGQGEPPQQQAAQAAQEAAQAQQEASQQNAAAAQEAANALNQAARQMAKAVPGLHPDNGQDQAQEDADAEDPSHDHARALDSKQGISAANGAPIVIPAAVRDIGITEDQWAKLPDLARKELMNAAQQSGPPAYRQMIKDYYVRVAKLQQNGAATPSAR